MQHAADAPHVSTSLLSPTCSASASCAMRSKMRRTRSSVSGDSTTVDDFPAMIGSVRTAVEIVLVEVAEVLLQFAIEFCAALEGGRIGPTIEPYSRSSNRRSRLRSPIDDATFAFGVAATQLDQIACDVLSADEASGRKQPSCRQAEEGQSPRRSAAGGIRMKNPFDPSRASRQDSFRVN